MSVDPNAPLLLQVKQALDATNAEIADHAGVSLRTVQRWWAHGALIPSYDALTLAKAVFPVDRELAARLALTGATTLEALGLQQPPQPAALPPRALPEHADSVVYAAADALELAPKTVRPAIVAAFQQAQRLGLTVEALVPVLAKGAPKK